MTTKSSPSDEEAPDRLLNGKLLGLCLILLYGDISAYNGGEDKKKQKWMYIFFFYNLHSSIKHV